VNTSTLSVPYNFKTGCPSFHRGLLRCNVAVFAYPLIAAVKRNVNYIIHNHRRKRSAAVISSLPFTIRPRRSSLAGFVSPRVNHTRSSAGITSGECVVVETIGRLSTSRGRDNATTISPGCFDSAQRPVPPRRLLPRARTCVSLRDTNVTPNGHDAVDARWFTEPLKEGSRIFLPTTAI